MKFLIIVVALALSSIQTALPQPMLLLTLKGHHPHPALTSVAFSPDGKRLATGSRDWTAKVWDTTTGKELLTLEANHPVNSVAFSSNGRQLVTGSGDAFPVTSVVKVWDARTGRDMLAFRGHTEAVYSIAIYPKGNYVVTGSRDKTAQVWDIKTGEYVFGLQGHTDPVVAVAVSSDERRILTGSIDATAKLWDAKMGKELFTLRGHKQTVRAVAFSPNSRNLVTASSDSTAKLWEVQTGHELLIFTGHTDALTSVGYSPDGKEIATGSWDKTVKVWDAATGQEKWTLQGHSGVVTAVAFSPDGKRLATASSDSTTKIWLLPKASAFPLSSPEATWKSLLTAMQKRNESRLKCLTTPEGLKSLELSVGGNAARWDVLQRLGEGWSRMKVRWKKRTKDTAEARLGPVAKEQSLTFQRRTDGWVLHDWKPGL